MTVDVLQAAAQSLTFTGGLALLNPRVTVSVFDGGDVQIAVSITVPERDDRSGAGRLTPVSAGERWAVSMLAAMRQPPELLIQKLFTKLLLHELDEGLLFGGVRLFDPHPRNVHVHHCPIIPGRKLDQFGLPCPDQQCNGFGVTIHHVPVPPPRPSWFYTNEQIASRPAEFMTFTAKKWTRLDVEANELRTWWEWECAPR